MPTKLLYLDDSNIFTCSALIIEIKKTEEGKEVVITDQTVFYPQGGGQPYDTGEIVSCTSIFSVEEVRFIDGFVYHIGHFKKGIMHIKEKTNLFVNEARRTVNRRYHTAGHIIDIAIKQFDNRLTPVKGFHFPEGAYVEYQGLIDESKKEELRSVLQSKVDDIIHMELPVSWKVVQKEQLSMYCDFVPSWIPENKPIRIVQIGEFRAHPCGGTHIRNTKEIKKMLIEKVSSKKGNTRISYSLIAL